MSVLGLIMVFGGLWLVLCLCFIGLCMAAKRADLALSHTLAQSRRRAPTVSLARLRQAPCSGVPRSRVRRRSALR